MFCGIASHLTPHPELHSVRMRSLSTPLATNSLALHTQRAQPLDKQRLHTQVLAARQAPPVLQDFATAHKNSQDASREDSALSRRAALLLGGAAGLASACPQADAAVEPFCGVLPRAPTWAFSMPWQERLVPFEGYQTWVREVGQPPGGSSGLFGIKQLGGTPKSTKCA